MENKESKILELLGEIEKQAIQLRYPILMHALGGGAIGAGIGAALPVNKENQNTHGTRLHRSLYGGLVGATLGGSLKAVLNAKRLYNASEILNTARLRNSILHDTVGRIGNNPPKTKTLHILSGATKLLDLHKSELDRYDQIYRRARGLF